MSNTLFSSGNRSGLEPRAGERCRDPSRRARLRLEALEDRVLLDGAVHITGTIDPKAAPNKITNLNGDDISVLRAITAKQTLPAALLLSGPGIKPGTTIKAVGEDNTLVLDDAHPPDALEPAGEYRFKIL
jgi:hypothetical protein